MQTFMPYCDFNKTMECLDKKRCWKQVLEARQILATLGVKVLKKDGDYMKPSHVNHPIHEMWRDYEDVLMHYHDCALVYSKYKWNISTDIKLFTYSYKFEIGDRSVGLVEWNKQYTMSMPWFMGYKPFHDAHKSNLLRKNPEWYGQFGWDVPDNLEYIWRQDETLSCKLDINVA